jgi:predicted permease
MFLQIFGSVLLPLVVIVGLAFALGRTGRQDYAPLARTSFYLFNPSLAFVSMATAAVTPDLLGRLALLKVGVFVLVIALSRVVAGRLKLSGPSGSAFLLASSFANSGNYGLFVAESAFGKPGLALAVICYVVDNLLANSAGVYVAARGRTPMRQAFFQVFRNPALYAVPLGLAVNRLGWAVPLPAMRVLEIMGRAAVPTMLVVLGLQLAMLPIQQGNWTAIGAASVIRLVVAPLLALILVVPLGLTGLARQVGVLQVAVPTAVLTSIIAARYDTEPRLVAGTVMVTSLVSLITITALLSWMA